MGAARLWTHQQDTLKYEPRSRLLLEWLTRYGYVVATIHYRLPGKHRYPAPVEDGKTAVRWLRANAGRLHRAGVPVTLVEDNGIEHVWSGVKLERAIEQPLHFLDHHLRPREGTHSASR